MPKPNYNKQFVRDRDSGGDRDFGGDYRNDRRVTFKPSGGSRHGGKFGKNKDWSNAIRSHLEEEDIDMNLQGGSGKSFKKNYGKKKGNRPGSPAPGPRRLFEGPTGWYKVSIPFGEKYDKSFLLKLFVENVAPLSFWPISWHSNGHTVFFYVDDQKVAQKLLDLDKKVQLPNGFKLLVRVQPGTPNVDMTSSTKEKMKLVMAKRYNAANKALDLTKFHADPDLQDCFCALFKPIVFIAVLDIIKENIPDMEALCLNDNKVSVFGFLKNVQKSIPNLKILHLGNNKIRDLMQLDAFIGLPIVELFLHGNPLCDKFKEQSSYISEVRKRFPKCMKLDGIDLPPPISFDITEETAIPETRDRFLCSPEGEITVRRFIDQYFAIYDSGNRQPLLEAYHEKAMFSFTMCYPYGLGKDKNVAWLNWYQTDNRNILRVPDIDRKCKLLKQGQLSVVSFLQDMPETKHDINGFTIDLTLYTPQMLCLTISGMFKELKTGHKVPPTRFFFRTLVIVPVGSGLCIANEVCHITNATPEQAKEAFKAPSLSAPIPGTSAPPSTPEASPVIHAPPVMSPMLDNNTKQEMINQIALKTGMNMEWSIKCLEGNDWDFVRACATFDSLQSQGAIPAEAFMK
ncbi:nuclear RNA export factor 1-like isoform X2 [Anthonomus grandis grandis]|uniref:nuclear RNA export factor 1-like isoform X2 n=1 Tax=Anthonomus grandis grandis TaxID=2921223 RepID=UPI00216668EE|nr:nuclear RNA export factor 1-like isoform X2 [Anthonomus grandis grandis]